MNASSPRTFTVRVLRQDLPGKPSYWNVFHVEYEADMNVISALQKIAESPVTVEKRHVAPVVLGMQLPGRGLRVVYDGDQRPRAAGLHGPHR